MSAVGIFDSGYGGLTVFREIEKHLPQYDYIYLGDNARAPYGDKDFDTVYQYTLEAVKWLFENDCSLVILACNTASAKALRSIQQRDIPSIAPDKRVLGVIRPTSEVIGDASFSKHIGILGTQGTVQSGSYLMEIGKFFPAVNVTQQACPEWVPMIESGNFHSREAREVIHRRVKEVLAKDAGIDTLLLACTHYPLIRGEIEAILPAGIKVLSQGEIVAKSLVDYLQRHPEIATRLTKNGMRQYFTTGDTGDFERHAGLFLGREIGVQAANLSEFARRI